MGDKDLIDEIERRIDLDYRSMFPGQAGWELGALHLLFAHNASLWFNERAEEPDRSKYALMHAFRWGKDVPSSPLDQIPSHADLDLAKVARKALERGREYVSIYGAFMQFRKDIVTVRSVSKDRIEFDSNLEWAAFDALVADAVKDSVDEIQAMFSDIRMMLFELLHYLADTQDPADWWKRGIEPDDEDGPS